MHVLRYFELELSAGSGSSRFRFPQLPRPFKGFGNGTEDNTDEFEDLHVSEDTAVFDPASTTTTSAGQLSNHRSPRAATSHHDDGLMLPYQVVLGDPYGMALLLACLRLPEGVRLLEPSSRTTPKLWMNEVSSFNSARWFHALLSGFAKPRARWFHALLFHSIGGKPWINEVSYFVSVRWFHALPFGLARLRSTCKSERGNSGNGSSLLDMTGGLRHNDSGIAFQPRWPSEFDFAVHTHSLRV